MPEDEEPAAWQSIAQELLTHKHQSETLAEQRPLFEEFLAKFPTAVSLLCLWSIQYDKRACPVPRRSSKSAMQQLK